MTAAGRQLSIDTPVGPAVVVVDRPTRPRGLLVLGHGAGGGIDAPDLRAARGAALDAGWVVARVSQPYRVAGRRSPPPAATLDAAWCAVLEALRRRRGLGGLPLVTGGRSSGARVACRTAPAVAASAVLALAFPLRPPARPDAADRSAELRAAGVPVYVVQGERDPFGRPDAVAALAPVGVYITAVAGADHALRTAVATGCVRDVVTGALSDVLDQQAQDAAT
jgi:predicted alpha/beta-hydrolase family hydrolase